MGFIFACKDESCKWLAQTVANSKLGEVREVKWDARRKKRVVRTWRYVNDVPIWYDERDPFMVNHFSLDIRVEGAKKPTYFNSWVTDKAITGANVAYSGLSLQSP